MQDVRQYDVVICGGGMVGLSMALMLAPVGLRIALLDHQPAGRPVSELQEEMTLARFDSRVSALTPASSKLLTDLGVWPALTQLRVSPYTDMHVWDADGTGSIHFAAADLHIDCLGHIVENSLVSAVLADALTACGNVELLQPARLDGLVPTHAVEGHRQLLTLASGELLSCRLLIGADGGESVTRGLAGFSTREWDYGHRALVATVKTGLEHQFTAWQRFMPSGPLAFLPLALPGAEAQHYSSVVWSCVPAVADELLALPDDKFAQRLEDAFESRLGKVLDVSPRYAFDLRQKHARDYVQQGVALVGDAAHVIHPLAGQGVNLGLADVASLGAVLKRAVARGEDIASAQVLSRYQRDRKAANLGMMLVMEGFRRAFGSDNLNLRWLRNSGLKMADSLVPFKHAVMTRAMGLK